MSAAPKKKKPNLKAVLPDVWELIKPRKGLIGLGIVLIALQLIVSIRNRDALRDRTGDPWNGRTLEWSTS